MYLKNIVYKNVGVLSEIKINPSFMADNLPKPIIIVGENGSGKSTFLSNIVDSFYEIAGIYFSNVHVSNDSNGYRYYKIISPSQIKIGQKYMYSFISYNEEIEYIFKSGNLSFEEFKSENNSHCLTPWNDKDINYKNTSANKEKSKKIFNENVICFFGPNRYEKPNWMMRDYYRNNDYQHPSLDVKYDGSLNNPISVENVMDINMQWLLDIIVDTRVDVKYKGNSWHILHYPNGNINNYVPLGIARENIERIMSQILKRNVYFDLNLRNNGLSRFNIKDIATEEIIVPSLDSLSTGEIALFNMFSTIIKYADKLEINNSVHINDIKGIVLIDEIELHLHSSMQREVLPKLLKLFPKVQFIITTHSPLFLLGMREQFGDEGFDIFELPVGNKINAESFSEFQNAFDYMMKTHRYQNEILEAISIANNQKTLIITEGSTDWRHIKAAYNDLSTKSEYEHLFSEMEFEFYEYDPKGEKYKDSAIQLEMGGSTLCTLCENISKLRQNHKIIFIADCDDSNTNRKLKCDTGGYKNWGNNVFSILLPLPENRQDTPLISIEHYYSDYEIKTEVDINGISRRLYMGNEFDERGINVEDSIFCERKDKCGKDKICIIEGSSGEKVTKISDPETNIALSKMEFAKRILNKEEPFNSFNFCSFVKLFKVIKEIIDLPLE